MTSRTVPPGTSTSLGAAGRRAQGRRDADRAHDAALQPGLEGGQAGPDDRRQAGLTGPRDRRRYALGRPSVRASGVLRPLPVSRATTSSPSRMTPRRRAAATAAEGDAAGRLRVDALQPGHVADGRRGRLVVDGLDRAAAVARELDRVAAVGRVADGQRADDGVRLADGLDDVRAALEGRRDRGAAGGLAADEADRPALDEPELGELLEAAGDPREHRAAGDRGDDDVGRAPAERLGDLVGEGLGPLRVERPQVDVDEAPAGLVGDLQAQAVDVVVGAGDRARPSRRRRARGRPWPARGRPG